MRWLLILALSLPAWAQNTTGSTATGSFTIGTTTCGGSASGTGGGGFTAACGKGADENAYCTSLEVASFGIDGPAAGPLTCNFTARSASPSNGTVRVVNTAADLTAALTAAVCGDVIQLTAGITVSGNFTLPSKSCTAATWITIRTSGIASLPVEGTRVTPCYFGVSSLPGRPNFNCASTTKFGATIQASGSGNKPFTFASGVNYVRVEGIEFRPDPANANLVSPLVITGNGGLDHVVFDQVWGHGNASDEVSRFTILQNSNHVSFVNSFFTDFKCITSVGTCTEAQVILAGIGGGATDGTYKIYNNFLEAGGEVFLSGGGAGATTPFDFEFRQNHFFLPQTWNPADASYNGGVSGHPFTMKNLMEFKNIQRIFIEGNVLENSWIGQQTGQVFTLTPVTQQNGNPNAKITDIIIRYNSSHDTASAMQVSNTLSTTLAIGGNKYSIHDNIFDNVGAANACAGCSPVSVGFGAASSHYTNTAGNPDIIHDVKFDHNTVVYSATNPAGTWPLNGFFLDGPVGALQTNYTNTNNITTGQAQLLFGSGNGCAIGHSMIDLTGWFNACWTPGTWTMTNNAIVGGTHVNWNWPPNGGVTFPATYNNVGFVNYNNGSSGDYRLCTGVNQPAAPCAGASAYHNAGTDGADIGANVDYINSLITGVMRP